MRYLTDWYAIVLCVWSIPTFLTVALWFGVGPLGPDHTVAHPSLAHLWPLALWLAVPVLLAPFGLAKRTDG